MADKLAKSKQVPPAVVAAVVADLRALLEQRFGGNKSALGRAFGVKQGSASAWFSDSPGLSWESLSAIEAYTKKDYANRRSEERARAEAAMKWRALEVFRRNKQFDLRDAFDAVDGQKHDLSRDDLTWQHYYDGAEAALEGKEPPVPAADIPLPPGPPSPPSPKVGSTRHKYVPISDEVKAATKRELTEPGNKRPRVRSRPAGK